MTSAVVTEDLTRCFGPRVAVDRVDLDIPSGEMFGLVGPNGAGKTTLIRILCAILRPSGGAARVLGYDVVTDAALIRPHIGYMSQAFSLYQTLTVTENLRFYGDLYGRISPARRRDVCRLVGLDDKDLTREIAGLPTGVRQRVALAAAVLHQPRLLFLDEPTSGVDPVGRRDFWALIRGLAAEGTTVIVTTHVMTEAERCDRVALMLGGRALAVGAPAQLQATTDMKVAVVEARPWQRAYGLLSERWPGTTLRGTTVHVPMAKHVDPRTALADALSTVDVVSIALEEPTFEDTFIWLIRQGRDRVSSALSREL